MLSQLIKREDGVIADERDRSAGDILLKSAKARHSRLDNWQKLANSSGYSVAGLAANCGMSVRTLQRFFQIEFGDTPSACLKRLRLQRALELLRKEPITVKEVATLVGYGSVSHFSRDFKAFFHYAPSFLKTHDNVEGTS